MNRKFVAGFLAAVMALGTLAGCGGSSGEEASSGDSAAAE